VRLIETHRVPSGISDERLSDYLPGRLQFLTSRKGIKKAIKKGLVQVDGEIGHTGDWIKPGQLIEIFSPDLTPPRPLDIKIEIIYEDEHLVAINKPAGLAVSGNQYHTVVNAIQGQVARGATPDALPWPHPVHRLDAPTSGLLLLAKSKRAQVRLGHLFAQRQVNKTYQAIVCGPAKAQGTIEQPLDDKPSLTTYRKVQEARSLKCGCLSLLELHPHTGRTHQLRRHLAGIGLPILGDKEYTPADNPLLRQKGLFLCAVRLELPHPIRGEKLTIALNAPAKFEAMMRRAQERWEKFR